MNAGWVGRKGQGKSFMLAKQLDFTLNRNRIWHEKNKLPIRKCAVKFGLADYYIDAWHEYLEFWSDIAELPRFKECDVFADDITTQLDQHGWSQLDMAVRSWLRANERHGCDFYFNAQNFAEVEITFRRLTDRIFLCSKWFGSKRPSATKPVVEKVWGIIRVAEIPEEEYRKDSFNQSLWEGQGKWNLLKKYYIDMYDHQANLPTPDLPKLKHMIQFCEDDDCPVYGVHHGKPYVAHGGKVR